ncbi:MAG: LysR family transcriptional regulator [Sphingorhabdus sp.]|uniref:LysR family transcriptional regulator n=1 Tax=Sphingorhabdus sp. TaxID=1902408 RepID=UPI003CA7DE1C
MAIEIRHLRAAIVTAGTQSFSRAAKILSVKQSALSRRVQALEQMLGVQLFERTKRGTFVTENGKAFLTVAERIVTDIDNLLTTAKNVSYGEQGRLAIGFSSSLMTGNLRFAIGDYIARYPDVQFDGIEGGTEKLFSGLQARMVDAAITPALIAELGITRRNLWTERLVVAVPEGHRFTESDAIHWTDLRNEVFVLPTQGIGPAVSELLAAKLGAHGHRAKIIAQDTSIESVISTVTIGRYITIVTEASTGVNWPELKFLEIADNGGPARLEFALYWRPDNQNPALAKFLKMLQERYPVLQSE